MASAIRSETAVQPAPLTTAQSSQPLPLKHGERLTRAEFERRYHAMPGVKKAELIEGVVYMPSPVRYKAHGKPHSDIHGWLFNYTVATPGVEIADNATLRLDQDNNPQPDLIVRINEAHGGNSYISADDYLEGAPELLVEIASSTAVHDLGEKLEAYRRNGVREYLVWQVPDRQIDWFSLQDEQYIPLLAGADGVIESRVFPGLRLNVAALLEGDLAKLLADLQEGITSAEQAAFVQQLAATRQ